MWLASSVGQTNKVEFVNCLSEEIHVQASAQAFLTGNLYNYNLKPGESVQTEWTCPQTVKVSVSKVNIQRTAIIRFSFEAKAGDKDRA